MERVGNDFVGVGQGEGEIDVAFSVPIVLTVQPLNNGDIFWAQGVSDAFDFCDDFCHDFIPVLIRVDDRHGGFTICANGDAALLVDFIHEAREFGRMIGTVFDLFGNSCFDSNACDGRV